MTTEGCRGADCPLPKMSTVVKSRPVAMNLVRDILMTLAIKRTHNLLSSSGYHLLNFTARLTTVQDIQDYASLIFWHTVYNLADVLVVRF